MNNAKRDNIILNNPVLIGSLGFVSVLTATVTLKAALLMSLAVGVVLLLTSIITSLLKNFISEKFESLTLLILIVGFATVAQMLLQFYYPLSSATMGLGVSLIAVNSLILNRLQVHAVGSSIGSAVKDAITNGIGYTLVMVVMGTIRELFGRGTVYGLRIIPEEFVIPTFSGPILAFILLGLLVACANWYVRKTKLKGLKK